MSIRISVTLIAAGGILAIAGFVPALAQDDSALEDRPTLASSTFYGGPGNQMGRAIGITGGNIYLGGQNGEFVRYAIPPGSPTASSVLGGGYFYGMTPTSTTVYPVGQVLPPFCGASDGVGDTEPKSLLSRFDAASGGLLGCQSTNFFPYRGYEGYYAAVNDGSTIFATGFGETCGFGNGNFVLAKHDLSGALLNKVSDPGVDFNGYTCIGGSNSFAVALLNGAIYVAGQSNLTGEDGVDRPVLMRYSSALARDWKVRPTDNSGGAFFGVVALDGYIYAVGYTGVYPNLEFLIEKYDETGVRIWSKVSGGSGEDVLYGITAVGRRLFAVGYTKSQGAGGADAVLLQISPRNGNITSTTTFGGSMDDVAYSAVADGSDLYIVGASKSFANGGNQIGESDIMLLRYTTRRARP